MKFSKQLILPILLIVAIVIIGGTWLTGENKEEVLDIDVMNQPTIGNPNAPIKVVVFEELKCPDCREYNNQVFPLIKRDFIDTGKILYTVIPVSFLPHSMPAAIALLCVYNQDPGYPNADLFFRVLSQLYQKQWQTEEEILQIAQGTSSAIDVNKLKNCLNQETFALQVENNTSYGKKLEKGALAVPSVFVDGVKVPDPTFEKIAQKIKSSLPPES